MEKHIIKECSIHGKVSHFKRPDTKTSYRCTKCATDSVIKRRKELIEKAKAYKGNCCQKCGYNKCDSALEFHHIDPSTKLFGISQDGSTRSWIRIKSEVDKCVLVCANCHREIHEGLIDC